MRQIDPRKGLFPIGIAAEIIGVDPSVLRFYEKRGLIQPTRSDGNRRLYSLEDIGRLEYVHYMTHVRKVNLAGVKVILELLEQLPPDVRQERIAAAEAAVDALDGPSRRIFKRGSATVERTLLDEGLNQEIERQARREVDGEGLPVDGDADLKD